MLILQTIIKTQLANPKGMLNVANSWSTFFAYDVARKDPPKRSAAEIVAFRSPYFVTIQVPRHAKMFIIHIGMELTHARKKHEEILRFLP